MALPLSEASCAVSYDQDSVFAFSSTRIPQSVFSYSLAISHAFNFTKCAVT